MANGSKTEQYDTRFVGMTSRELIQILIWGALVGLATWILTVVFNTYVYEALLCKGDALKCDNSAMYATITGTVLAAIGSLFGLVRMRVYRPLLIVLAATITLWGTVTMVSGMAWYYVALMSLLLYALAYGLFAWIARIRYLWLMLFVTVVLIVIVRLVLN